MRNPQRGRPQAAAATGPNAVGEESNMAPTLLVGRRRPKSAPTADGGAPGAAASGAATPSVAAAKSAEVTAVSATMRRPGDDRGGDGI